MGVRVRAVLLAAGIVAAGVVVASGEDAQPPAAQEAAANTEKVARGPLSSAVSLDGTLSYRARPDGAPYTVINRVRGTYTELPDAGDRIDCGDVLYRVDDRPVLLLCGAVPAYRGLRVGDEGTDVRQLHRNLHRLGHDADPRASTFTWTTAAALSALQRDRGADVTGELGLGDAVVLPEAGRIARVDGELGGSARPGAKIAQATSTTLEVQMELAATHRGDVSVGDEARVTLPSNRVVKGTVGRIGKVARTAGKDAAPTIPASIRLDRPQEARGLGEAPVQVSVATAAVSRVLSVPVVALVGKAGGGFAVEVVRDGGRRELVGVRLGLFDAAAGRVAVRGALAEGDRVVVPSP